MKDIQKYLNDRTKMITYLKGQGWYLICTEFEKESEKFVSIFVPKGWEYHTNSSQIIEQYTYNNRLYVLVK